MSQVPSDLPTEMRLHSGFATLFAAAAVCAIEVDIVPRAANLTTACSLIAQRISSASAVFYPGELTKVSCYLELVTDFVTWQDPLDTMRQSSIGTPLHPTRRHVP